MPAPPVADSPRAEAAAAAWPVEPLTLVEEDRHTVLPLRDPEVWALHKKLEACMWPAADVIMTHDRQHWREELTAGDRAFYTYVLAMFGPADEYVGRNLSFNFLQEIKLLEACAFLKTQALQEVVHSESYSIMIETCLDGAEKARVQDSVRTMPIIGKMMEWAVKWMDNDQHSLGLRIAAFAVFEGVLFQGQFMAVQLLKERNLMPGFTGYNELISRDEGQHCLFACFLLRHRIRTRPTKKEVHAIVREAVALFDEFIVTAAAESRTAMGLPTWAPCPVQGITEERMQQYVRFVANAVCGDMDIEPPYNVANPYPEGNKLVLNRGQKTNFFEYTPTQYMRDVVLDFTVDPARAGMALAV